MVFFLSIGLLINLDYIAKNWDRVLLVLLVVTLLKTTFNVAILHFLGQPWKNAMRSGVIMGQIGEFSFIIAATGLSAKILSRDNYHLLIAVIALSLLISPMWLAVAKRLHAFSQKHLLHNGQGR